MREWQPIETAPKDGTEIMSCVQGVPGSVHIVWWELYRCPTGRGEWFYDIDSYIWPTHWMPLPEVLP